MTTVTICLPADIAGQLQTSWPDLSRGALEAIALEAYRSETITREHVARLLGMSFWEVEAFLKARGAYVATTDGDLDVLRDRLKRERAILTAGRFASGMDDTSNGHDDVMAENPSADGDSETG